MNWFERYGIPGFYFMGHTLAWIYVLYPCLKNEIELELFIPFITVIFLPIGYIITVLQHAIYLKIPSLGILSTINKKEKQTIFGNFTKESELEGIWEHFSTNICGKDAFKQLENRQAWSRKRMDVMAISFSIVLATILEIIPVVALLIFNGKVQGNPGGIVIMFLISILIILLMIWIWFQLRRSIIVLIEKMLSK